MGVFFSHSFWTSSSLDVPAGITQEEGHTGFFLIHLLSAVRALTFLANWQGVTHLIIILCSVTQSLLIAKYYNNNNRRERSGRRFQKQKSTERRAFGCKTTAGIFCLSIPYFIGGQ